MARYIDADELIEMCERMKQDLWNQGTAPHSWADAYDDFETDILRQPTADVVPKSEWEKLQAKIDELKKDRYQILLDGRIELIPRTDVDKIKSDLAREIFEEIDKEIEEALKSSYEARRVYNPTDEFGMWVQGKIDALRGIEGFLTELKKKYTGDYNDG